MTEADNFLETGLFNGLLSGNCGYFIVLHNKNLQVDTKIALFRSTAEFEDEAMKIKNGLMMLASLLLFIHY
jgi:hypothetical protein